jgi:hypothetical protein
LCFRVPALLRDLGDGGERLSSGKFRSKNEEEARRASGEEKREGEPVVVRGGVLEGFETMRRSGRHMAKRAHAPVLAQRLAIGEPSA